MTTDTSPSASEIAADLTTACVHAWQAMGRQGASSPANAMHAAYAECQAAIEAAGPGLHLRCAEDAAEIARLQAQVAELQALSVTHILLGVVPGDGMGEEVYAKSVADVEALLSKLGERAEEADSLQAQIDALQREVSERRVVSSTQLETIKQLTEALDEARTGLKWYQDRHPESTDGSDDEAMARIDAALLRVGR